MRIPVILILILVGANVISLAQKSSQSKIIKDVFYSSSLKDSVNYQIYLPAQYNDNSKFPILYLLHGHGGNEKQWSLASRGNMQFILDSLIEIEKIPAMVAVTLDAGKSWYVDRHRKMESAYINDFIPFIENRYNIDSNRDQRMIAGNSAGGYGTLRFALKYPNLFHAAILLSPAAYYPEPPANSSSRKINVYNENGGFSTELWRSYAHPSLIDDNTPAVDYPMLYISTGDDDAYNIVKVVVDLQSFLKKRNISHELTIINGGHNWYVWRNRLAYDLARAYSEK